MERGSHARVKLTEGPITPALRKLAAPMALGLSPETLSGAPCSIAAVSRRSGVRGYSPPNSR